MLRIEGGPYAGIDRRTLRRRAEKMLAFLAKDEAELSVAFVDDAIIFDRLVGRSVQYGAPDGPQVTVRFDDFPTLGVWTKVGSGFVCIEQWHGFSDPEGYAGDLFDKPSMIVLPPGEEGRHRVRYAFL